MDTKQIRASFFVIADNKISVNLTISVDGVQKFSGALAHTDDVVPEDRGDLDPNKPVSVAEFDLELPINAIGNEITVKDIAFAVTGGSAVLCNVEANYNYPVGDSVEFTRLFFVPLDTWSHEDTPFWGPTLLIANESMTWPTKITNYFAKT
jgi:hypothetical protein